MPPRFAYWTILIDGQPTAFRARDAQELLPTLGQLKRTNSDVVLRWFARGQLWESPEAERAAGRPPKPKRTADWRPGGEHRDPRTFWREKKKERNQQQRAQKHARREQGQKSSPPPTGRKPSFGKPSFQKPSFGKPSFGKPSFGKRSFGKPPSGRPAFTKRPAERPSAGPTHRPKRFSVPVWDNERRRKPDQEVPLAPPDQASAPPRRHPRKR